MPTIAINNEEIFYARHGASAGAPIIFVHGAGGTHQRWLPQVNALQNCTAYALDLPGHGQSSGAGRDNVAAYADVLLGFLDAMLLSSRVAHAAGRVRGARRARPTRDSSALIAGHSLGGAIGLWLALHHPKRVRGLLLVGSGAKLRVHPKILQAVRAGRPIPANPAADTSPEPAADLAPADPVAYGDWLACDRFDVMNRLHEIACPTLVIHGANDPRTPPKYATYMAEHIKGARLVTIADAGHNPMHDKPDEVTKAIQEFVNSLP